MYPSILFPPSADSIGSESPPRLLLPTANNLDIVAKGISMG